MIVQRPTVEVDATHFVETEFGVADIEHFRVGAIDYLLIGLEDGSLHLYNYTKNLGNSYSLKQNQGKSLHSPYDQFLESNYEHGDSIVSIELQPVVQKALDPHSAQPMILTASKDGILMIWSINPLAVHENQEEMLVFRSEADLKSPLTKAKWLSENQVIAVTTQGEIFLIELKEKDSQN